MDQKDSKKPARLLRNFSAACAGLCLAGTLALPFVLKGEPRENIRQAQFLLILSCGFYSAAALVMNGSLKPPRPPNFKP